MNPICNVTSDSTGTIVTFVSGRQGVQFRSNWKTLPIVINGKLTTIQSVTSQTQIIVNPSIGQNITPIPLSPNRETIYQAFFNLVASAPGLVTTSRSPQIFDAVPASSKPYLFVEQVGENPKRAGIGMPYNWELDVAMGIYCYSGNPLTVPPVTLLNPILDSLESMLAPSPTNGVQNLGGIVYEARLLGSEKQAAGAITNNAWAYVPARIYVV